MNITFKMIEAFGNILHVAGMNVVPPEFASIIVNTKWGFFKENTPDVCRYVDLTFTDGKVIRFVTQNKNKRYEVNNPKVLDGRAQAGQLKPYAIQALGGAQITWVISNPYAPRDQQAFLGHVYNGQWKPKQDNAYTPTPGNDVNSSNVIPGTYVPTQTNVDPGAGTVDQSAGTADPNVPGNAALMAMMPLLMKALGDLNKAPIVGQEDTDDAEAFNKATQGLQV